MGSTEASGARSDVQEYGHFTPRLIWEEIAPHTWPASLTPTLLATALAASRPDAADGWSLSFLTVLVLMLICVLMQASVNVFNDYFDYVSGNDTVENSSTNKDDAVLVYNHIKPSHALGLAVALMAAAFVLGIYIIAISGWIPLVIALVGAAVAVLYSGGPSPISYHPIGELASGVTMGGLITLACYYVLTGSLDWLVLVFSIPCIIGIGLIMATNNTCDIDKDREAGRHTLPVVLGHEKAVATYHGAMVVWVVAICVLSVAWAAMSLAGSDPARFTGASNPLSAGLILVPFMILACYPTMRAIWRNPLVPASRDAAVPQMATLNVLLTAFYVAALLLPAATVVTW